MADVNQLSGSNPIASLYPQPAPAPANLLAKNPLELLGQVNALRQFQAKQAVGQAFQNALNPDLTINRETLAAGLKDPSAALGISDALDQYGKQVQNDTAVFNLGSAQNGAVTSILGAAADDNGGNPNIDTVRSRLVDAARVSNIPSSAINAKLDYLSRLKPAQLKQELLNYRNMAIGSAGVSGRGTGAVTAEGAPTTQSVGQLNQGTGAVPTQLAPMAKASQDNYVAAQNNASTLLSNLRPMETAFPLIEKLNAGSFGPGTNGVSKAVAAFQAAGIIPPDSKIGNENDLRQELNKYLNVYTSAARAAGRSDAGLDQAKASTPNLDLTQGANLALVKNQMAMDRQDAALSKAYDLEHPEDASKAGFNNFKSTYYQNHDQRAFVFDKMNKEERGQVLQSLGAKWDAANKRWVPPKPGQSPAFDKFARSYDLAKKAGIVMPAQVPNGQQ